MSKTMSSPSITKTPKNSDQGNDLCSGWWLEVGTENPLCINFYGPFTSKVEAEAAKQECVEEFKSIYSRSRLCQPRQRTIKEKELTLQDLQGCPPTFFEALLKGPRIY